MILGGGGGSVIWGTTSQDYALGKAFSNIWSKTTSKPYSQGVRQERTGPVPQTLSPKERIAMESMNVGS